MKAKMTRLWAVLLSGMVLTGILTGCGTEENTAEETTDATEVAESENQPEVAESEQVVMPLYPLESAQDALADGGYSVSFTADNLVQTETGYDLTVEVFEYDRYEMNDIEQLAPGSQIQVCNETVTVEKVENNTETGFVMINGGIEEGGLELKEEDGLYRMITMDDYPVYYSVGKVTIPLSEEVTLEDHVDWNKEPDGEVYDLAGLVEIVRSDDTYFTCANTVITVRQEQIVQIIRYWTP